MVLITKGDLLDQERKLAQSGLGDLFDGVEIVSDKTAATYARIFARHGARADHGLMVGNSLKSDVIPALQAGAWGVHVPHARDLGLWNAPIRRWTRPGSAQIDTLADLPPLVAALDAILP